MKRGGDGGAAALFAALLLTAAVGLLDFLTPADVDFGELYMIPVILVTWAIGRKTGIAFAITAAIVELLVDDTLRSAGAANGPAVALWNGVATLLVLAAIAVTTDIVYRERERWTALDAERSTLLRVLEQELPRPLRAADWFARTFEDAFGASVTPAVKAQFAVLRHHTREAIFLATDLLALGQLRMGGLRFERAPVELKAIAAEAVGASLDRSRVLLSSTDDGLTVLADPDRLRHAVASVVARFLEMSPYEPVTILLRSSGDDAVVEIACRARAIAPTEVELAELLVAGNGGRLVLVPQGSPRGATVTMYFPRVVATAASASAASASPASSEERAPRT
jgi:signal transduction histidine kinase